MKNNWIIWSAAILLTLLSAYYQRVTGPTHPLKISFTHENIDYSERLIRSYGGTEDAAIYLKNCQGLNAQLYYRHYPQTDETEYTRVDFTEQNGVLAAFLPNQPPAGKLEYYINIADGNLPVYNNKEYPIVIRFKGAVPAAVLLLHVLFIFAAMLFSNVAGMMAAFKSTKARTYTFIALGLITVGGMILGPIVQKYAFGEFWTGIPKGYDLTDNKTLIAFIAWIAAGILNYKKTHRASTMLAAAVTIIIFSIPHSLFGSTLNRETGKVVQGLIFALFIAYPGMFKQKNWNE